MLFQEDNMKYKVTDNVTGETFMVDESEVGQYQNQSGGQIGDMGGATGGIDSNTLLKLYMSGALGSPGSTTAGRYLDQLKAVGAIQEPSASEQEGKVSKQEADRIVADLEDRYFGSPNGPLAYGRTEGASQRIQAMVGNNPSLADYLAYRGSVGAKFAKAMGDVGNISQVEQENAIKNIPTGFNTPEEAVLFFKSVRSKMGLPERNLNAEFKGLNLPDVKPVSDLTKLGRPQQEASSIPSGMGNQQDTPIDERNLLQRIFNTGEDIVKPLPDQPLASEAGALLGRFAPLPPGIRTAVGSGIGKTVENVAEGLPLTQESAQRMGYNTSPNLAKLAGPLGPVISGALGGQGYSEKESELLNEAGIAGLLDLLFSPQKTIGGIRGAIANKSSAAIPGEKIAQAGVNYASSAPATARNAAQKYALQGIDKFSGQNLNLPQALKEATASQGRAFTLSGQPGQSVGSAFERVISEALRKEIAQQSPAVGNLTTALSKLMGLQSRLGSIGKLVGSGAVGTAGGAGSVYALQRLGLLGQ